MKKLILKIVIGIVAVPTVVLGGLYITRGIPAVSEKVIIPLAKVSENLGIPVIVKPKYSDEMIRNHISVLKRHYYVDKFSCPGDYPNSQIDTISQWLEKIGCVNAEGDYQNVKSVNSQEGFGTEYVVLLYSSSEGYNLTWREYLEMYLNVIDGETITKADKERALELDLQENIPIYNSTNEITNPDYQEALDKEQRYLELTQQCTEAYQNGEIEKAKELEQQIQQMKKEMEEEINKNN